MVPAAGNGDAPDVVYGIHAVREALRAGTRPLLRLLVVRQDRQFADLIRLARAARVPIHVEPRQALDRLVPDGKHQGVIGLVVAKQYDEPEAILDAAREQGQPPFIVILDGIEDPHNLGAVLRTAEAAGVHGAFIPERRAVGLTGTVAKASAGALEHLRVGSVGNLSRLIEFLKSKGLWVYALDPSSEKSYTALDLRGPLALVLGGESRGIRPGVLEKCDERVKIPMLGQIESLNVSAAAAIVLFEAVRQRTSKTLQG
ncbi:MAG: 23S rRNA (guanosine(2251)-2'-O)-methyltransferase RlmB [Nitrospiraceae bacterium]